MSNQRAVLAHGLVPMLIPKLDPKPPSPSLGKRVAPLPAVPASQPPTPCFQHLQLLPSVQHTLPHFLWAQAIRTPTSTLSASWI